LYGFFFFESIAREIGQSWPEVWQNYFFRYLF
jgi:hypothetical protein